jgi:hypothetical protein
MFNLGLNPILDGLFFMFLSLTSGFWLFDHFFWFEGKCYFFLSPSQKSTYCSPVPKAFSNYWRRGLNRRKRFMSAIFLMIESDDICQYFQNFYEIFQINFTFDQRFHKFRKFTFSQWIESDCFLFNRFFLEWHICPEMSFFAPPGSKILVKRSKKKQSDQCKIYIVN